MKQVYNSGAFILTPIDTAASGTGWTAFESYPCNAVDVVNNSGTSIDVRRNAGANVITIPDATSRLVVGVTNANQVSVKRTDDSTTQVEVQGEALGSA